MAPQTSESLSRNGRKGAATRWGKEYNAMKENHERKNKPEFMLLKARLCGFLAGDGRVFARSENRKKSSIHYEVNFYPDHISLVNSFLYAFETLYGKRPVVEEEQKYYRIRTKCKFACLDLLDSSNFGIHRWEVPLGFLKTEELKREWLRAFFDCEGHVAERQIQVQSVNKKGLYQVKRILEEFQIESRMYSYKRKNKNWSTNYILCVLKKESRKTFLEKIGFNHEAKLLKLTKQSLSAT